MSQPPATVDTHLATTTPRALILDLFGDYLRYAGGEARAGELVALLGAFGVEPATVRVTLSRLRRESWFTTRREGREVSYVLAPHMLDVLRTGRERIFAPYDERWDGRWTTVVQLSSRPDRMVREQLRRQLRWLGFGALTGSTWMAPRDRTRQVHAIEQDFPDVQFTVMRSRTGDPAADREIVERCWDLAQMDARYRTFLDDTTDLVGTLDLKGAAALVARLSVTARYRHFPFTDPWLPIELRPAGWSGSSANERFRQVHDALGPEAEAYVSSVIGRTLDPDA
jgi:phenylacetic acid degradation operon negative regulatory protein